MLVFCGRTDGDESLILHCALMDVLAGCSCFYHVFPFFLQFSAIALSLVFALVQFRLLFAVAVAVRCARRRIRSTHAQILAIIAFRIASASPQVIVFFFSSIYVFSSCFVSSLSFFCLTRFIFQTTPRSDRLHMCMYTYPPTVSLQILTLSLIFKLLLVSSTFDVPLVLSSHCSFSAFSVSFSIPFCSRRAIP